MKNKRTTIKPKMTIRVFDAFTCNECGEYYLTKVKALECCGGGETQVVFECPKCRELHECSSEAVECCVKNNQD